MCVKCRAYTFRHFVTLDYSPLTLLQLKTRVHSSCHVGITLSWGCHPVRSAPPHFRSRRLCFPETSTYHSVQRQFLLDCLLLVFYGVLVRSRMLPITTNRCLELLFVSSSRQATEIVSVHAIQLWAHCRDATTTSSAKGWILQSRVRKTKQLISVSRVISLSVDNISLFSTIRSMFQ